MKSPNQSSTDQKNSTPTQTQKSFLRRFWWVGVIIVVIVIIVLVLFLSRRKNDSEDKTSKQTTNEPSISDTKKPESQWPSTDAKYITAVPLDLTQIQSISKYRSCSGHDRSGYSFDQVLETNRSMKHYLFPTPAFQGTLDKVKMFAPFDGKVSLLNFEKDKVGGRPHNGNGITFSTPVDPAVGFQFGHIYFVKDYKTGDEVKAGELIGYAALGDKGNDFDIDLMGIENKKVSQEILGSAFDHMNDSVLAEFAKYGVTPENTKVSKEYRDSLPCDYTSSTSGDDRSTGANWVQLER